METYEIDALIHNILTSVENKSHPFQNSVQVEMLYSLIEQTKGELFEEDSILHLDGDFYVVGDIHGNANDLIRILQTCGYPPDKKYLFLGDYVDRGNNSLEVICLLFALKCRYPNCVYLLRGNHEIERISNTYGFYDEAMYKFNQTLYNEITDTFNFLPFAAIVNKNIFCVHGGIGPHVDLIDSISLDEKPDDIIGENVYVDFLWSDPKNVPLDFIQSKRGSGYYFNSNALSRFLEKNNFKTLIRSHEMCKDGMHRPFNDDKCITVFSNTDYCGRKNHAAVAFLSKDKEIEFKKFKYISPKENNTFHVILPNWLMDVKSTKFLDSLTHSTNSDMESPDANEIEYHNSLSLLL
ncbi:Ser/Thr protein phosphatase, putative [Trichomonas vaginalis G3]|uniref:Serine/threonine-protein phosphatase n=1 Tax=Trichomonas vaginalis (strain ATCC PRA-98 / G3) TaxID=412133 RepID=A2F3B4_TRIV3|nr:phosphoprotein phosphatase protein [Trichomonas vaginalis G3]EAY00623.1 Ser/Thr protein phosphatase, putative [Trichomonas vaginalis G3]KAI5492655.1 phosphoprotein phosphatase protein [Trichomonas vaginalis G3]|eukprot:XP_001313552.1 Ser/Thr protein phosphatase [Trichomonas vaginalis G3]